MISVLVAFRGSGVRLERWEYVRAALERDHPEFEIVVGTDDGQDPFHKTLALNRAAAEASGDVFYVMDSDTWVPPEQVRQAVEGIASGGWWRPWSVKWRLGPELTGDFISGAWDGLKLPTNPLERRRVVENVNTYWASPPLMLSRELYEDAGRMDERFRGWGHEDTAFGHVLVRLAGQAHNVPGRCLHLYHPRNGRAGRDWWDGQEPYGVRDLGPNLGYLREYERARRSPEAMRRLIRGRNG